MVLEKRYNSVPSRGQLGYRIVKVSATNREVAEIEQREPVEDQNLILKVDLDLTEED